MVLELGYCVWLVGCFLTICVIVGLDLNFIKTIPSFGISKAL